MKSTLRSYIRWLIEVAGLRLAGAVALIVLCSLTEGAGVALLLPALQMAGLDLKGQGDISRFTEMVSRAFEAVGLRPTLLAVLAVIVLLTGARTLLGRMQSVAMFGVEQICVLSLRRRLYRAIANANWLFLCRSRSTDFTHALTEQIVRVGAATYVLLMLAADLILGAVYVTIAFELSSIVTIVVLASGTLLVFIHRGRTRALHESGTELTAAMKLLHAGTIEHLQSLKTAKTYSAQENNFELFSAFSQRVSDAYMATARQQASAGGWFETGSIVILCAVLYVSIETLKLPPAAILILLVLFSRVMPRFMSSHQHYRSLATMLPAFASLMDLVNRCEAAAEPVGSGGQSLRFLSSIRFEKVSFSYRPGGTPVIHDLDLAIPAGRIVAIVGTSGAGKSTIADLAMGLLVPDSGRIAVDGEMLRPDNAPGWREQIGYVAQETSLFHLSVRENLLWARPGASEGEIIEALRLAAAEEFTLALPQGLDAMVGERGILISQGERQRLALARALLRRPTLLVLDEATNSLDSENETKVLSAIEALRGELTVLLIAHRLSTIRWADLIYVVQDGTVVEAGSWNELNARRDGRFRALCAAQSLVA